MSILCARSTEVTESHDITISPLLCIIYKIMKIRQKQDDPEMGGSINER